jgi:hypothetical protein
VRGVTPAEYVRAGWVLVPIAPGTKGPTGDAWNAPEHCVATETRAEELRGSIGLAHAYSGTCALDLDDLERSRTWFSEHGVNLDELLGAPDAVQLSSGRPNRAKLIYRLDRPLPSKAYAIPEPQPDGKTKRHTLFEFRCGTSNGRTVQDVLPPSIHPDTGVPYQWKLGPLGNWRDAPKLPPKLRELWLQMLQGGVGWNLEIPRAADVFKAAEKCADEHGFDVPRPSAVLDLANFNSRTGLSMAEARERLSRISADDYHDWMEFGAGLEHEFGEAGFEIWDEWSRSSPKYPGQGETRRKWESFGHYSGKPITLRALIKRTGGAKTAPPVDIMQLVSQAPAKADRRKFKHTQAGDFVLRQPPGWLLKGLIPKAALGVVFAEPGAGKTFWTLDLALRLAAGLEWNGRKPERACRVAYVCAEGLGGFMGRLGAASLQMVVDLAGLGFEVFEEFPNLTDPEPVADLIVQLKELGGFDVVVVDTLAQVTPGANENAGEDMGRALAHCKAIHAACGAFVLLVHHAGKDPTKGARGWSGLRAACDVEIEIIRNGDAREARVTKLKDGEDGGVFHFKLLQRDSGLVDGDGEAVTSCVVQHVEPPQEQVRAATRAKPRGATEQIVLGVVGELTAVQLDGTGRRKYVDVVEAARAKLPRGEGRDRRKELIDRALTSLSAGGWIEMHEGEIWLP